MLVADTICRARALLAATARLREAGLPAPVIVGVHALFAGDAHARLLAAGAARVVTCNTVPHPTNAIDVTEALASAVRGSVHGVTALGRRRRVGAER